MDPRPDDDALPPPATAAPPPETGGSGGPGPARAVTALVQRTVATLDPLTGTPSSPIETTALVQSLGPSLMPRNSMHQGFVTGLSVVAARRVGTRIERVTDRLAPQGSSIGRRLLARGAILGAAVAMQRLPAEDDDAWPAALSRLVGGLARGGALGGILYDLAGTLDRRMATGERGSLRTSMVAGGTLAYAVWSARSHLAARRNFFTDDFDKLPLTLPRSLAVGTATVALGTGLGNAYDLTRRGWHHYYGPGITKRVLARGTNSALWAAGLTGLYWLGITRIGESNEKIDPGYAEPPTTPLVTGSPDSPVPFEELGQQGRRFVTDVLTPELISEVMGEDEGVEHPVRVFIGYDSQPLYSTGRSELALDELERTGAYDKEYLLLVSPTGTGWVDHTMLEATELFARGRIATVCIQYGRYPSFLSLQKVRAGRRQFRQLAWGVHQRLQGMDPQRRPKVLVFGESLGAWASSDVVMKSGVEGFDHYSIDRALWFGMPHLARWSAAGLDRPGQLTPEGTVGVFDRWEELQRLTPDQRDALRVVQLSHDNDPITRLTPAIAYRRPEWLADGPRGRGVPEAQRWAPVVTFLQTMVDAANAMRNSPGEFRSTGHDYRADTARFVAEGYRFAYTEEQMARVEETLRRLEKERAERISPPSADVTPAEPPARLTERHRLAERIPSLRGHRTAGPRWTEAAAPAIADAANVVRSVN